MITFLYGLIQFEVALFISKFEVPIKLDTNFGKNTCNLCRLPLFLPIGHLPHQAVCAAFITQVVTSAAVGMRPEETNFSLMTKPGVDITL